MKDSKRGALPVVLAVLASMSGVVTFGMLLVGLASHRRTSDLLEFLRDGGLGIWVLLLSMIFGTLVTTALSAWLTLRERAPDWAMALFPCSIVALAALFEEWGMTRVVSAVSTPALDDEQRFRIMAMGISEVTSLSMVGALCAVALLSSIAVVFGARAMSRVPSGALGASAVAAFASGALGLALIAGVVFWSTSFQQSGVGFGWLPALSGVLAATLGGVALSDKNADDQASSFAFGDLSISALYALAAVFLAGTVVQGAGYRAMGFAVSSPSIDASQRARIGGEALVSLHAGLTTHWVWAIPVLFAVIGAAAPATRFSARGAKSAWSGLLGVTTLFLFSAVAILIPRMRHESQLRETSNVKVTLPEGVDLASVRWVQRSTDTAAVEVRKSSVRVAGREVAKTDALVDEAGCKAAISEAKLPLADSIGFTVDGAVEYRKVACLISQIVALSGGRVVINFLAKQTSSSPLPAPWGGPEMSVGIVKMALIPPSSTPAFNHLHLGVERWTLRIRDNKTEFTGSEEERLAKLDSTEIRGGFGLTTDPEIRVDTVLKVAGRDREARVLLDLVHSGEQALSPDTATGRALDDFGSLGQLGSGDGSKNSKPPAIRQGAPSVSGKLAPEVIQRIVRQNFGRFRLCYENGLRNNPTLQGRVVVKFVIGADGAVSSTSDGGSDLPDKAVVQCVLRSFGGLSFPAPEGGMVTVTFPISFTPGT